MNMQYVHACTLFFCIFSEQKRGAQRMSGCLLVLFFWLSPEQPHELLACMHHSNLAQQTVVIFLLGSPLLFIATVPKCFTNIKVLIFTPFTWTCNNSTLLIIKCNPGKEVKNIPICIPRWRHGSLVFSTPRVLLSAGAAQAPAFCQHSSCAFLSTWAWPRC